MITYTCVICKETIIANKQNDEGIVRFDDKYWHKNCFIDTCKRRTGNKRYKKYDWQDALDNIDTWQRDAQQMMQIAVEKDDLYNFLISHYKLSCTNTTLFTRLQSVYDGTYHGLLYPISPKELMEEWEYYYTQLVDGRTYKNMTDEQAIPYDLAILLAKNAEYREIMERRKIEAQVREAQKSTEVDFNEHAMIAIRKNNSKQQIAASKRRAELFREVMGDGN
jgi:hypothetical protein